MRAVVTGSNGFIGKHLCKLLEARGDEVVGIDLPHYDVQDIRTFGATLWSADVVFHLAALPSVQESIDNPPASLKTNTLGTLNVLDAALKARVKRVVFASSCAVYGEPSVLPIIESMPTQPMSPYAEQKAAGESYCRFYAKQKGLKTVCLRFFNVCGEGARAKGPYAPVIALFLDQARRGVPLTITGDGTQTRDFVHVSDVVRACLLAAVSPRVGYGEAINIGSGRATSVNEIAEMIGGQREYIAPRVEPHDSVADIERAWKLLRWKPCKPLEQGIGEELKRLIPTLESA